MRQPSVLLLSLVWWLPAAAVVHAEPAIPMPKGASPLPEPYEVQVGSGSLEVHGFTTEMDLASLQTFYEQALPKAGWRLEPLPWQARQADLTKRLEQTMKTDRAAAEDPNLQATLKRFQQTQQAMRRALHASSGSQHVIVHFMALGQGQIAVFINRWDGAADWMGPNAGAASAPMASWLGQPNVCCSGEEVPGAQGPLPFGMPRYPGAALLSKSAPRSGDSASMLLKTPDPVSAVADFYRRQMAYNGWEPVGGETPVGRRQVMMYRNARHLCGVMIQGDVVADGAAASSGVPPETLVTITVMSRPAVDGKGN